MHHSFGPKTIKEETETPPSLVLDKQTYPQGLLVITLEEEEEELKPF